MKAVHVSTRDRIVAAQADDGEFVQSLRVRVHELEQLVRALREDKEILVRELARLRSVAGGTRGGGTNEEP